MATVSKWTPFGVALDVTATSGTVTRTSATAYTVVLNVSWETYYNGAKTNYGMTATSGGVTKTISAFNGTNRSSGSASFTGTYSISGNGAATKTITVSFKNFNTDNGDTATKNVTLSVSVPAVKSYKVSYNANGGTGAPSAQTKWQGQTLTLSTTKPTRSGYTFVGWGTSTTDTTKDYSAGGSYTANAAATLYAIWSKTITLTYNANGGSGAPGSQSATVYNATTSYKFTLPATKPTRSECTFLGWSTNASATSASYSAGGSITLSTSDTLYAVWKTSYVAPKILYHSALRCNSSGEETESGTYAKVSFSWSTFSAAPSIVIAWESADGTITGSKTVTVSGTSGSVAEVVGGGALTTDASFAIRTTITDSSGGTDTESSQIYGLELPFEAIHENGKYGVAIGKPAESVGYLDIAYKTKINEDILLANQKSIYAVRPDGTTRLAFKASGDDGGVSMGYGNYAAKDGDTVVYGHDVSIGVSNLPQLNIYRPYRRQGDTISITYRTAGYVTNSGKDISFWLPVSEPIIGSPTVTVASNNGFILRQGNSYTHGSTASIYVHPDSYEATATYASGIYIKAVFSNTANVTNNDAIGIYWSGTITLS